MVGVVSSTGTVLNVNNIKLNNIKIYSSNGSVGGIVGCVISPATLNLRDIDFKGEVYSSHIRSDTGRLVGNIRSGGVLSVFRVIVEAVFQNTFEPTNLLSHSERYLGGIVDRNETRATNITIEDAFFTGSLFTESLFKRSVDFA